MRDLPTRAHLSHHAADLCAALGVRPTPPRPDPRTTPTSPAARALLARLRLGPALIAITGPSGGGKSTLLRALARRLRAPIAEPPAGPAAVLDSIRPRSRALAALAHAGLAEAGPLLRTPAELSDGQRRRLALAQAIASRARRPILIDEFTSSLDRPTAMAVCITLARWARRARRSVLVATAHDDVLAWLSPDLHALIPLAGPVQLLRP